MTKLSALAVMVFQLLEQQSEALLYRQGPDFYIRKFRRQSISFEYLWQIFVEIIAALPGLRISLMMPSSGSDASAFVMMIIDLYQAEPPTPLSIVICHITDAKLSDTPTTVELDNEYDIEPEMDASEALSKVAMLEMGLHGRKSENLRSYVWSSLWATLRYDMMVMTFHLVLQTIKVEVGKLTEDPVDLPREEPTWLCRNWLNSEQLRSSQAKLLKRRIIAFLQLLPYEIPHDVYHRLRQSIHAPFERYLYEIPTKLQGRDVPRVSNCGTTSSSTKPTRPTPRTRSAIWRDVEQALATTVSNIFCPRVRDKLTEAFKPNLQAVMRDNYQGINLKSAASFEVQVEGDRINILDLVGRSIFIAKNWDSPSLRSTLRVLQDGLLSVMELGVLQTKQSYLLAVSKPQVSVLLTEEAVFPVLDAAEIPNVGIMSDLDRVVSLESNEA